MERCLVRAEIYVDFLVCKSFPKVYYIALVCYRYNLLVGYCLADTWNEFVEVCVDLVHPTLIVALVGSVRIYLCTHTHYSRDYTCLRLRS